MDFQPGTGANTQAIRVVTIEGNPWFVAKDAILAMGYKAVATSMVMEKLDDSERILKQIEEGVRSVNLISESGLYKLAMRSDKPEAKGFQDWVTKVVLPAIRKDGGYVLGEEKVASGVGTLWLLLEDDVRPQPKVKINKMLKHPPSNN